MKADSPITLAVLAGGASVRMGRPKAELVLSGKPVLQYLLERHAWDGPTLLITAPDREHPPGWEQFGREVSDSVAGEGPLRGILTALQSALTPLVLVMTIDMPCLGREHVKWMIDRWEQLRSPSLGVLREGETGGAIPLVQPAEPHAMMLRRQIDGNDQVEPFPFLCRVEANEIIGNRLATGRRSIRSLTEIPGFMIEPIPPDWPPQIWTNLNSPADWTQLQQTMNNGWI